MRVRVLVGSAQHIGARESQQDSFAVIEPGARGLPAHAGVLAIVADGMGGMANGGEASAAAVATFVAAYSAKAEEESVAEALARSLEAANQEVFRLANAAGVAGFMGTTLTAAVAGGNLLHWVSVGDSRAYLLREGELRQLTEDHIFGRELDAMAARGEISSEKAFYHPERESLTSFVGGPEVAAVNSSPEPLVLGPGDRVILCTDGLYRFLPEHEIAAAAGHPPEKMCKLLVSKTVRRRDRWQDNVTVLALALGSGRGRRRARRRLPEIPWPLWPGFFN